MKIQPKTIRIIECISTVIIFMIFFWWVEYFVQVEFPSLSFDLFQKFIMPDFNMVDGFIIRFFPIVYVILYWNKIPLGKSLIKKYLEGFVLILSGIIIGLILAYFTWSNKNAPSPYLPEYLKYQPWIIFWTPIFISAILIPLIRSTGHKRFYKK
jgi:hypothetical protein